MGIPDVCPGLKWVVCREEKGKLDLNQCVCTGNIIVCHQCCEQQILHMMDSDSLMLLKILLHL